MAVRYLDHGIVAFENLIGTRRPAIILVKHRDWFGINGDKFSLCSPQVFIVVVNECHEHGLITENLQRNAVSGTVDYEEGGEQILHTLG